MNFRSGIMTGVMICAAAGIMATPMINNRTKRKIVRTSKRMMTDMIGMIK